MWQMGGPGPMLGQVHHFVKYNPGKAPYAEERYLKEAHRLYGVLNERLADHEFVADDYSIADIAIWPWVSRYEWQTVDLNQYPNVLRWYRAIAGKPGGPEGLPGAEEGPRGADAVSRASLPITKSRPRPCIDQAACLNPRQHSRRRAWGAGQPPFPAVPVPEPVNWRGVCS